jgi:hypothetical protein
MPFAENNNVAENADGLPRVANRRPNFKPFANWHCEPMGRGAAECGMLDFFQDHLALQLPAGKSAGEGPEA